MINFHDFKGFGQIWVKLRWILRNFDAFHRFSLKMAIFEYFLINFDVFIEYVSKY